MAGSQRRLLIWVEREVARCAPIGLRYFRSRSLRVERKHDRSPVTIADRRIEERLRRAIARACPGEPILGEEFGASRTLGSTYWTIDPIDGTRAFSCGLPTWAIMVAHVERGWPTLGVCHFPSLGTTLSVAPGVPAYERTGRRVTRLGPARAPRSIDEAAIFTGGSHWWRGTPYARGFDRLMERCYLERAYGDCWGYLWAFRGYVDAVIDYGVKPWDLAPLAALARATGRALVDFSGRSSFSGPETVLGHPRLARTIGRLLRGVA